MLTPAAIVHAAAGRPAVAGAAPVASGRCAICAAVPARALPYRRWEGSNFAGQADLAWPGGEWVCEPCAWAMSWVAPPDREQEPAAGKTRPRSLRMYGHLWSEARGYWSSERGDLSRVREWLRAPERTASPWFAAIPIGGKKHLIPATPLNPAGATPGRVRFEEQTVAIDDWTLCDAMTALLAAKVRRAEIDAGDYHPLSWQRIAPELRAFEATWARLRGSGWFALALWLAGEREDREAGDAGDG